MKPFAPVRKTFGFFSILREFDQNPFPKTELDYFQTNSNVSSLIKATKRKEYIYSTCWLRKTEDLILLVTKWRCLMGGPKDLTAPLAMVERVERLFITVDV